MSRPVLGVIACNRMVGSEVAQAVMNRYIRAAMTYADVAALIIPSLPDLMTAAEVAPRIDGILLTGSPSNVATRLYGDEGGDGPFDDGRDEIAMSMVDRMIDARKPVFGICRGFQEINVALGGTLRRDTSANDTLIRHHAPDDVDFDAMFDHRHPVELADGGMLSNAYAKGALDVNSVHFQGIGTLADGLTVEARAPDGLIEAYSARPNGAPLLAVQWHPEWGTENDADSQTYFHLLGKALRGNL
ncbi:MAG: gamma-glutamyl-gamma-aminobutyrate hydrolase family protein [Sphingorhabdus sp.]|jgi:putative glutamine amidotransferase|uniref:gamma-glutamyl-gamma-aminobutyrate hydrolase family protein n=1 Tax=Sphingorhabdus sp. TaxID=1902408 RepID=UPI00273E3C56|nr:gamma-glutamyl-gamma-aminobutyrate hydrolase family protein [Sphingorhabdus sp.]MDP4873687.1 gamma-glutamyl-gamma-aminobutyrate hydrolase family protein [Sphingorhabdus sp.]